MGNRSGKTTDRRIPSVPHYAGDLGAFACCCKERRTAFIEEKRVLPTPDNAKAEEDLIFLLTYKCTKPRSLWMKIYFGLHYFFLEVCPMICCPPCPPAIIHKLAFRPPERPTYDLIRLGNNEYRIHLRSAAGEFFRLRYRRCQAYASQLRCFYIQHKSGPRVACVYARALTPSPSLVTLTILYSHNNGIDLGLAIGYVILLARRYRVNVFAYDYAGYGRSSGQCSEHNLYQSAEMAYDFLTNELNVPGNEIVAVGTSLGTAATIHLASTSRRLRGVVLQGGFLSALRVVCPTRERTCRMDQFVNVEKIKLVKWPTLVIHGKDDQLFSVEHAETLRRRCPGAAKIEPLLISDCGHIDFDDFAAYWQRIHKFLHIDLSNAAMSGACCTYHALEVALRQDLRRRITDRHQEPTAGSPTCTISKKAGIVGTRISGSTAKIRTASAKGRTTSKKRKTASKKRKTASAKIQTASVKKATADKPVGPVKTV